jgi:murein DD-endopeptidase MepM/ murein hydrolase activator NlpD
MIYKVRIMSVFILSTLLLSSLIYFSFNLLGPSLSTEPTETIVTKKDIYETNEKKGSIARIASNYKHLKIKSNISDILRQQTENNKHSILNKNRILELESELKNIQKKLKSSFDLSNKRIEKLKIIETKNTNSFDKWSILILMDLVDMLSKDKEKNLKELEILTKSNQRLHRDLELIDDQNEQIFSQLEDALTVSIGPLKNMLKSLGLPAENIIQQLRKDYSGKGGLFDPKTLQSSNEIIQLNDSSKFAEEILAQIGELNLYRIAAEKLPIYNPIQASNRFTSGFGYRKDPKTKKKTMHHGVDFAAPKGTLIYSTGDGIVTHAGWKGSYGLLVVIKHAFGFQTKYAHNSRIYVKVGNRVSRGDKISAMGSTGRSTGTHLHYEVRRNNKPLNPITFIKAGRNVF